MHGSELIDWLLKGGLAVLGGGLGWVVVQIRAMRKEARDSEETVTEAVWARAKTTMAEDRARIKSLEEDKDRLATERDQEKDECSQRVEAVRVALELRIAEKERFWEEAFNALSRKYRDVLKICADQEEEIQHSRIVIAKINQRRTDPMPPPPPAQLLGGTRAYDPRASAATVTVTVPAAPGQPEVSVTRDPPPPP